MSLRILLVNLQAKRMSERLFDPFELFFRDLQACEIFPLSLWIPFRAEKIQAREANGCNHVSLNPPYSFGERLWKRLFEFDLTMIGVSRIRFTSA